MDLYRYKCLGSIVLSRVLLLVNFVSDEVGYIVFCFSKQKTAYEMRISDWSSGVCSSDLHPPESPHFGTGRHEQLHISARRNDRSDIAPIQHRATRLVREIALPLHQRAADSRVNGHARCQRAGRLAAQFRIGEERIGETAGFERFCLIVGIAARPRDRPAYGAIQHARVEMGPAVMCRKRPGNCALAGRSGTITGDDHHAKTPIVPNKSSTPGTPLKSEARCVGKED